MTAIYSLLRNAPITEALIDVRVKPREGFDIKLLEALHDVIINQYPEKKARQKFEGKFEIKKGEIPMSSGTARIDGYIFLSADKKQVFQARIDGFTFNRLKPYEKWESLRDEAFSLWKLYRDRVSPEIVRVALRYINKFDIPLFPQSMQDFKEYLTAAPIVPEGLPQGVSSFLTRLVIHDPNRDATAIFTQVFEQIVDPKFVPIILDIDVFKQKEGMSEEVAWQTLEGLRHFKNEIFFASITEKAREMFQ
jgi:uncharacterized protein (TIGR04255 family)